MINILFSETYTRILQRCYSHSTVEELPIVLHFVFTVLLLLLRRLPLTPPNRLPLPSSPPSQLVRPAQVWLRKKCVSLPCEPAQCVISSLCQAVRRSVFVFSCNLLSFFWMPLCFLFTLPLLFCTPRPALLLLCVFLSTKCTRFCVFCLSFPCICVFTTVGFQAGQQSVLDIPVFLLYFFVCPSLFLIVLRWLFMLTVCFLWTQCFLGIQNWTTSLLTQFFRQTLSLEVYLWAIYHEGQGHKNSSHSPNNCLTNVNVFSIVVLGLIHPNPSTISNTPLLLFMDPALPFLSRHSFNCFGPKHLTHTFHLPTPKVNRPHNLSKYSSRKLQI